MNEGPENRENRVKTRHRASSSFSLRSLCLGGEFSHQNYSTIPEKVENENELTVDKKVTQALPLLQLRR